MESPGNTQPGENRRAIAHREHVEAVDVLRGRIDELERREPELRKQIPALRKQIADLRRKIAVHQRAQAKLEAGDEADEQQAREADEQLEALNAQLDELSEQLTERSAELESLGPELIQTRCTLGMKMSDFALDDHEGHEDALTYLQPLLVELRKAYTRASWDAERNAADVDEQIRALETERDRAGEASALVGLRFDPLITAEGIAVNIEQANVRVARHRLALGDREDMSLHLSRELQLDDALAVLDEARARVVAMQEQKREAVRRCSHPTGTKRSAKKRFGRTKRLVKNRFGRR